MNCPGRWFLRLQIRVMLASLFLGIFFVQYGESFHQSTVYFQRQNPIPWPRHKPMSRHFAMLPPDSAIDLVVPKLAESGPLSIPAVYAQSKSTTILVFVLGLVPFGWATIEFWRRIAVGESFGTGSDSIVIIGEDDAPESSRGRRVLGKGALAIAYILFGVSALVLGVALYSVIVMPDSSYVPN